MDKKLESILKEFERDFFEEFDGKGIIKCNIKECGDESCGVSSVCCWVKNKLQSYAKDYALSLLPEEKTKNRLCTHEQTWYFVDGFNQCLKEIKNKI